MQRLVHAGILKGVRGPRGGYRLARERRRITVADVARVVYDLEAGDDVIERDSPSQIAEKVVRPIWRHLRNEMMTQLATISVEELCKSAKAQGIRSELPEFADYSI
jgi:Rrf2 family protein